MNSRHFVIWSLAAGLVVSGCGSTNVQATHSGQKKGSSAQTRSTPKSASRHSKLKVIGFWANDVSTPLTALYLHPHALSDFAPFWYSVDGAGNLKSHVNATILSQVQKAHIPITPLVNDGTGTQTFLKNPSTMVATARNIADMVVKNKFQGVNIDFEPPHTRDKALLTEFMVDLRDFMPRTDTITMDVVPHSGGAYDYAKLAPEVNQFILMSYDQHASGTFPGPIAGKPWVQSILARLLTIVPASKIVLGVALYGYIWPNASVNAVTVPYNAVTPAMNQAAKWDPAFQETYAHIGSHTAWWESLQGMNEKIHLAQQDHLAGVALWHVGYANNAVYQLLLSQIGRQP